MKTLTALTLILTLLISCGSTNGQSRQATDRFEVTEFTVIQSSVVGNIHIRQSPTVSVTAEGSEKLLNILEVRMDGDKLILTMDQHDRNKIRGKFEKLTISVTTPTLTRLDTEGVENIEIEGAFTTPELTVESEGVGNFRADRLDADFIRISSQGVGNITLGGRSDRLEIKSEGVGNVNTSELEARSVTIRSQGVGNVRCHASEYLNVRSEGIGNVTYYGNPTDKNLSKEGMGRIKAGD
ncbi:MAG: DUF2807 domain-containing protein [Proteiniphilum sp.]|jgi:hypothetical protein|nr:DUF2807 domain-containing protein [Proteiniphilum sp.]